MDKVIAILLGAGLLFQTGIILFEANTIAQLSEEVADLSVRVDELESAPPELIPSAKTESAE